MDLALLRRAVSQMRLRRDRILVLLSAVTGRTLDQLRALTWREAYLCVESGVPLGKLVRDLLQSLKREGMQSGELLFVSRKGKQKAIGRIQMWRVVRAAMKAIGFKGAFTLLRRLTVEFRVPVSLEENLDEFLQSLPDLSLPRKGGNLNWCPD